MRLVLFLASLASAQQLTTFETHLAAGRAFMRESRAAEADRELRAAIDDVKAGDRITEALEALCDLDLLTGKYEEAVALEQRAVAAIHNEADLPPHLARLAGALRASGNAADAEPQLEHAIALDTDAAMRTAHLDQLASTRLELSHYDSARSAWRQALDSRIQRLAPDDLEIATNYVNLGALEERAHEADAAREDYERALAISEHKLGPESYALTGILDRMGALYRGLKQFANAEPPYQRSLAIREKTLGTRHGEIAPALDNLATTYYFDARYAEAEPLYLRSLQIWTATQGENSPLTAQALDNLGALYSAQQRYPEAQPYFTRSMAISERHDIERLANLALIYAVGKDLKQAEACFERAILIGEKGFGGPHPEVAGVMDEYVKFLRAAGRTADAKKIELRAKAITEKK